MREPEFYEKAGYEVAGYESPKLSSADTYPDYIHEEVKDTVRKVQENQTHETVTFGFMTDLHYAINFNHETRMKRNLNAYREIKKRAQVDFLALGGDYTNEGCKSYKSDCFRELRALFSGIEYYPVNGNHDDGSIWDKSYLRIKGQKDMLSHDELYRLFYNHVPSFGIEVENHALYYFKDDSRAKIRYIFLDTGDMPDIKGEEGELKYIGQQFFSLSQNQIDWLINKALNFEEEGWSVVFFGHSIRRNPEENGEKYDSWKGMEVLHDILRAYKNGELLDYKTDFLGRSINVDFKDRIRAEIICMLVGDFHADFIEEYYGIKYIFTGNSVTYYVGDKNKEPRRDGDKTELLFDIVTIDKNDRKIYVTRVGAGADRELVY